MLMLSQDTDIAMAHLTPMVTMSTRAILDMLAPTSTASNTEVTTSTSARLRQETTTITSQLALLITQKEPPPTLHQPLMDTHHMGIAMVTRESTTTEILRNNVFPGRNHNTKGLLSIYQEGRNFSGNLF